MDWSEVERILRKATEAGIIAPEDTTRIDTTAFSKFMEAKTSGLKITPLVAIKLAIAELAISNRLSQLVDPDKIEKMELERMKKANVSQVR